MTTTTLTDRYVEATLRRLPADRRSDIERELRASIADAVDGRIDAGGDPADAEVAVLTELGDPARLAAGYADRPLYLIGPELFLDYVRLLRVLIVTIVPITAAAVGLAQVLKGGSVGSMIGSIVSTSITTGVHVAFWTTLLFAVLERVPGLNRPLTGPWTPALLPEPPSRRARYGELIAETVTLVLFTTLILLAPRVSPESDANGNPINVLSPWLWESGIVYVFIALVVASLGVSFANHYYARWNAPLSVAATLVDIAPPLLLIWLASNKRIVNPAFVEAVGWSPAAADWIHSGLIVLAIFTVIHSVVEGVRRLRPR
jgi:hypothetical protein